jgi:histidinol-phosphate/aromatic aminotransferase/cobyric acid decarboxylase-like protein
MHEMYSYPFPEVRQTIASNLDPGFMLNTLPVSEAAGMIATYNFQPPLELPANGQNELDLDELHTPVIERIRTVQTEHMPGLESFANTYPTHGSSQSMFTLLAEWKAKGKLSSIAVLDGEYEGYEAYANTLNIPVTRHESFEGVEPQEDQVWFISNPSAVDGNWIDKDAWKRFTEAGHSIVFDAAYVGLTPDGTVDVSSPNIKAVLTSPSKIFGVFRYRNTGVTYTREPVDSMYGTKWFKDIPALLDTLKLYETFGHKELVHQYRPRQERICQALSELVGATIVPSDVLLLGSTTKPLGDAYQRFARRNVHRFGLTKLFEDFERYEAEV